VEVWNLARTWKRIFWHAPNSTKGLLSLLSPCLVTMAIFARALLILPSVWAGQVTISNVIPRRDNFNAILDAHDSKLNLFEGEGPNYVFSAACVLARVCCVLQARTTGTRRLTEIAPSLPVGVDAPQRALALAVFARITT
jgi:hypothetical protein